MDVIQQLAVAYQQRNYLAFANLFPKASDNAPYLFILGDPLPKGQKTWDVSEELRLHRRMFNPENPLPGETPPPQALWLQSITITLTQVSSYTERPEFYKSPTNSDGLDARVWKAMESQYEVNLLLDTQSTTDYRVRGRANFVVIEDLTKAAGENRKYLIYRWEDLGCGSAEISGAATGTPGTVVRASDDSPGSECETWGGLKDMYRR